MAESVAALVDVLTRVSMEEVVMIACFVVPLLSLVHTTLLACGLSTMASASEATAEVANCAADAAAPTPQAHQLDGKPLVEQALLLPCAELRRLERVLLGHAGLGPQGQHQGRVDEERCASSFSTRLAPACARHDELPKNQTRKVALERFIHSDTDLGVIVEEKTPSFSK